MKTVVDLFTGIGSFSKELELTDKFVTILACDNNKFAKETFLLNNPHFRKDNFIDSISDLKAKLETDKKVKDLVYNCDVLCSGIPCQSFSVMGSRTGFGGCHDLIADWLDVVRLINPKTLLLENVRQFYKQAFKCSIWPKLNAMGYNELDWKLLNARDHGIPQQRVRFFAIITRLSKSELDIEKFMTFPKTGSIPLNKYLGIKRELVRKYAPCIRTNGYSFLRYNCRNFIWLQTSDGLGEDVILNLDQLKRLQGFDDLEWPDKGKKIFKTQKLRAIGNTIPRCLTRLIARRLAQRLFDDVDDNSADVNSMWPE